MIFYVDELWPGTSAYQHRLDADQLCRKPSGDPFLHHLQCLCCRNPFLPLPITNTILFKRVEQRIVSVYLVATRMYTSPSS